MQPLLWVTLGAYSSERKPNVKSSARYHNTLFPPTRDLHEHHTMTWTFVRIDATDVSLLGRNWPRFA